MKKEVEAIIRAVTQAQIGIIINDAALQRISYLVCENVQWCINQGLYSGPVDGVTANVDEYGHILVTIISTDADIRGSMSLKLNG